MIRYNVKTLYNDKQNYNSSTDFIVVMSDKADSNILVLIDSSVNVKELGLGVERTVINSTTSISDQGVSEDFAILDANINTSDFGTGADLLELLFPGIVLGDVALGRDSLTLEPGTITLSDRGTSTESMSYKSVANYNSRKSYNKKWDNGGASYNSYKHHIVMVEDFAAGSDLLDILFHDITLNDNAIGEEVVYVSPAVLSLNDIGLTKDSMSLISNVYTTEFGVSADLMNMLLEFPASEYFVITSNQILEPLGVRVTGDSRRELLPSTRDNAEEIPGRHGEIDFGTEFKAKMMELRVATDEGNSPLEKAHLQRLFAKYLDPTKGHKTLIFSDDIEKSYMVKYSGKIDITNHASWFEFVIPFKMSNPFVLGSFEKTLIGSGKLVNDGTYETGLLIEIDGPATNPSLTIGGSIVSYAGAISNGSTLTINTGLETAKIGSSNAISDYNGNFPLLFPGETDIVASGNVTIKWRDKWI